MKWRLKAAIQNGVALLPSSLSYTTYYWLQRHFGALRKMQPVRPIVAGIDVWKRIEKAGHNPVGSVILEVGTGRRINMPLVYWLAGAEKTITVDVNPYLREELIREDLEYLKANCSEIEQLFGGRIQDDRLGALLAFVARPWHLADLLDFCHIQYLAPRDASQLPLPANSVDFYTSYNVFEHIPPDVLKSILNEGNRVVKTGGLFVHRIDHSDHFSHSDRSISAINFLQFSSQRWQQLAGNRYMYMNRLRSDDYCELFKALSQKIVLDEPTIATPVLELLRNGAISLDESFQGRPEEVLATVASWIVTEKEEMPATDNQHIGAVMKN